MFFLRGSETEGRSDLNVMKKKKKKVLVLVLRTLACRYHVQSIYSFLHILCVSFLNWLIHYMLTSTVFLVQDVFHVFHL